MPILRFFAPQGRHVAPMGVKFDTLLRVLWSPPPYLISPPSVQRQRCRPPKLKFLLRFDRNVEYKRPTGAYPLHDFYKICSFCTPFQDALGVKVWLDLLEGFWSYGGFKLRASGFSQIFSAPERRNCASDPKSSRGARTCSRSSITMPSLVGLGFHPPPGQPKTLSFFVCLFVRHTFECQRLCARFRHEGVGVQKRF